ncbi:MAG: hypothetical protein AAGA37_08240 [Actinomycetota bacterium]
MTHALSRTLSSLIVVLDELQQHQHAQQPGTNDVLDFGSVRVIAQAITLDTGTHGYLATTKQTAAAIGELAELEIGTEPGSLDRVTSSQVSTLLRTLQVALTDQGPSGGRVNPAAAATTGAMVIASLAASVTYESVERIRLALQATLSRVVA